MTRQASPVGDDSTRPSATTSPSSAGITTRHGRLAEVQSTSRLLARCSRDVELFSRRATNLTTCFPEITRGLSEALAGRSAILDGEVVALDRRGRPSFELIQRRLRATRPSAHMITAVPTIYAVFDVLYLDGIDVTRRPYVQRRDLLEDLHLDAPPVITSPWWDGAEISAEAMFDVVRELSLEGFVIKRASSTYQAGRRSTAWTKAVVRHCSPMLVCGFIPGRGATPAGSAHCWSGRTTTSASSCTPATSGPGLPTGSAATCWVASPN